MEQVAFLDQPLITSLLSYSKNSSLLKTLYTASANSAWPQRINSPCTIFWILFMYVCVWSGVWGVDGGWMPLPTHPQRYCYPVSLYHVTSNGHISANFWKYGMKFFLEPLKMLYLQNRKKNWVPWPLHIVFRSMNWTTCFLWSNFWVSGPNFPMKLFREGHKI